MASGLSAVVLLVLCVVLCPCISAGDRDCKSYKSLSGIYHAGQKCLLFDFCCGSCDSRYCCSQFTKRLTEDQQETCDSFNGNFRNSPMPMILGIIIAVICVLVFICCCVCPCCCLYKMCRKPRPVINTTTVVTTTQQYPRQQVATPGQPAGYQYPSYQTTPMQPGYGTQPMPQNFGAQPMPTVPYQGQPYTPGPPPTYQEATCPAYPPNPMPYSQAAFTPGQTMYPLQPPTQPQPQPQPSAPVSQTDYLTQPAYNPDYIGTQPKTG